MAQATGPPGSPPPPLPQPPEPPFAPPVLDEAPWRGSGQFAAAAAAAPFHRRLPPPPRAVTAPATLAVTWPRRLCPVPPKLPPMCLRGAVAPATLAVTWRRCLSPVPPKLPPRRAQATAPSAPTILDGNAPWVAGFACSATLREWLQAFPAEAWAHLQGGQHGGCAAAQHGHREAEQHGGHPVGHDGHHGAGQSGGHHELSTAEAAADAYGRGVPTGRLWQRFEGVWTAEGASFAEHDAAREH